MEIKNKRFLVIGGAGLIGSHTVDLLLKEKVKEILIFDNFCRGRIKNLEHSLKDKRVKIFDNGGDITQLDILESAMEKIDGVFHFAALWLLHCWDYPDSAFDVNIKGTFNVVKAVMKSNVKRLVYSSSASVYGDALAEPMDENHPFNNNNFYGATKIASEQIIKSLFHRYKNEKNKKFEYVGLRYMNVYGKRQDYKGAYIAVIMKLLDNLLENKEPVIYGDGTQAYDFINVLDCAKANILAMKSNISDRFYNVGTGKKTTINELTRLIIKLLGKRNKINYIKQGKTFVKNRVGNTALALRDLKFKATISLEDGLQDLIDFVKNEKKLL